MNIMYVEFNFHGHRLKYINAFNSLDEKHKLFYLVPGSESALMGGRRIAMCSGFNKRRSLTRYFAFVKEVKRAVKAYKIDVVHILDGDFLYRYFGFGLKGIGARLVITYHHMDFGILKRISLRRIFRASAYGVVHTEKLKDELKTIGIKNGVYIDYPMLDAVSKKTVENARKEFGIRDSSLPVLAFVGNLMNYKGFDMLVRALNRIQTPCIFLVAGEPLDYDEQYIKENLTNTNIKVRYRLRYLTDPEFADAINAADVVLLPYRRDFDGASGPLVSAVMHRKVVIGAAHGSLGNMIKTYSLGVTYECENENALVRAINGYLTDPFTVSEKAEEFARRLSPADFVEKNEKLYIE